MERHAPGEGVVERNVFGETFGETFGEAFGKSMGVCRSGECTGGCEAAVVALGQGKLIGGNKARVRSHYFASQTLRWWLSPSSPVKQEANGHPLEITELTVRCKHYF
jgi:hypothetical protein